MRLLERTPCGPDDDQLSGLRGHVVVLNVNRKVAGVLEELHHGFGERSPEVVVVVQEAALWARFGSQRLAMADANEGWKVTAVEGCPAEPADLEAVGIERAAAAIILADERQGDMADAHSTLVAVAIERRSPQVHTVIELISSVHRVHLRSTEVNEVVCLGEVAEKLIAQSCITPGVRNILESLVAARANTAKVFAPVVPAACHGMTYRDLARSVVVRCGCVVCGFGTDRLLRLGSKHHPQQGPTSWVVNPRPGDEPGRETVLHEGDRLLVVAYRQPELARLFGDEGRGTGR